MKFFHVLFNIWTALCYFVCLGFVFYLCSASFTVANTVSFHGLVLNYIVWIHVSIAVVISTNVSENFIVLCSL